MYSHFFLSGGEHMRNRFSRRFIFTATLTGLISATGMAHTAQAAVIAYDGFDYSSGALAGSNGGTGWQGAWGFTANNGSLDAASVVAGLTFSDYAVTGGAAEVVTNANNGGSYGGVVAHRQISNGLSLPSNSTVYTSMLFRHVQEGNFANGSTFAVGETATGGQNRLQSQAVTLFGNDNPDQIGTGAGNSTTSSPTAGVAVGTTYLFIGKFTGLNIPAFNNAINTATLWAISETNYDAIKADGITEAELDANNVARAFRSDGPSDFGSFLEGGNYARLLANTDFGINNRSVFDEIKFTTELSDISPAAAIPEPTSLGILATASMIALHRRRSV
jgi:hypothetical protein